MNYEFTHIANPLLLSGPGVLTELPGIVAGFCSDKTSANLLIVRGGVPQRHPSRWHALIRGLRSAGIRIYEQEIHCEPSVDIIDAAGNDYREMHIDAVIAIGGGSVLDAGKAIAAMLTVRGSVQQYLEGVGELTHPGSSLPFVAVPTTAGTGSEATTNAVISGIGNAGFKKSLRHRGFIPRAALLDGELCLGCPAGVTAASGMDAVTQLIESFTSTRATPATDAWARVGLEAAAEALPACVAGADTAPRQRMLFAAYASGVALANAGLGVVHGCAGILGGEFDIPHGVICGSLLPDAVRLNCARLQETPRENECFLQRYAECGRLLLQQPEMNRDAALEALMQLLSQWRDTWQIPRLQGYGMGESDVPRLAAMISQKNNPAALSDGDKQKLLKQRLA